jgi:autotransporter translocation and assembly factor TamB
MRRLLHIAWILLVLLLAASLSLLYYVGWTESGLRSLSARLSRRIGPVTMVISGASGTLAGGAHIKSFVLDHRRAHVEAHEVSVRVSMSALLSMNIRAPQIHIGRAVVGILTPPNDDNSWQPHFLRAPLTITLPDVQIDKVRLIATNGRVWDFESLHSSGDILPYTIHFNDGTLRYAGIDVRTTGKVLAAAPIGLNGKLHFDWKLSGQPEWPTPASMAISTGSPSPAASTRLSPPALMVRR